MPFSEEKIRLGDRFKDLLDNEDFQPIKNIDKYGRKIKKEKKSGMKEFYYLNK